MAESKSASVEIKNTPDDISDIVSYYTKFAPTYDREIEVGKGIPLLFFISLFLRANMGSIRSLRARTYLGIVIYSRTMSV